MTTTLYGIPNCDTIKKAKKWLNDNNVDFVFHDYKKEGVTPAFLEQAETSLGWELMLNKRGTTFRQLDESDKANLNREKALALLAQNPSMIKRPITLHNDTFHIGFKPAQFEEIFC